MTYSWLPRWNGSRLRRRADSKAGEADVGCSASSALRRGNVMRRRAFLIFLACLGLALAAVAPVAAGPLTPGPLAQVSGTSAFLGCTADAVASQSGTVYLNSAVASQSGTVYLNSEVEPWIDVN